MKKFLLNIFKILNSKFTIKNLLIFASFVSFICILLIATSSYLNLKLNNYVKENKTLSKNLDKTKQELYKIKVEDQFVKNKALEEEINNIHINYNKLILAYNNILDLKIQKSNTLEIDKLFTESLAYLSNKNYSSASANITKINTLVKAQTVIIAKDQSPAPANITTSNTAPGSGFSRQAVNTDSGTFTIDIVAADLNSTRVIVDTASDLDCKDNCPVLPLATYVTRNGGFAGINGSYFCPATYPSCAGKTNSFDLLVMNKNKHYFNSDNNVYSTNPAAIFQSGSIRFVNQTLQWGRDTGVDGVLSNYPLLLSGGNVVASDGSKGAKDFVGNKGNTVYIGVIYNVTMEEAAKVLKTLGLDNAMNLDEGGSTALWFNGYKAGPGRDIPNAIIFVSK